HPHPTSKTSPPGHLRQPNPGSVLTVPPPRPRPYGPAMKLGIEVRDFPCEGDPGDDDTAAVVVCGATIALNPAIENDDLRADVLAMSLEIAAIMTNRKAIDPGEVYAPRGFGGITPHPVPSPGKRARPRTAAGAPAA